MINMKDINHIFVINLKKDTERWETMKQQFNNTSYSIIRWDAVYGKELDEAYIKEITDTFCNIGCSYSIIGCWLSHYSLWKYIAENDLTDVLILEDDVTITNFDENVKTILSEIPDDYDMVYFDCIGSCDLEYSILTEMKKQDKLFTPAFPLGMYAYMLSNKGAKKLVEYDVLKKVRYHIDFTLSNTIHHKKDFKMYALRNSFISTLTTDAESNLTSTNHPVLTSLLSLIPLSKDKTEYTMGYVCDVQLLNIRALNIPITALFFIILLISLFIGVFGSEKMKSLFISTLLLLYILEIVMTKGRNVNYIIIEALCVYILIQLGTYISTIISTSK